MLWIWGEGASRAKPGPARWGADPRRAHRVLDLPGLDDPLLRTNLSPRVKRSAPEAPWMFKKQKHPV